MAWFRQPTSAIKYCKSSGLMTPSPENGAQVKCAIAIDSGNECIEEIVRAMLPDDWRPHVTVATYAQWTEVIEMVRDTLPDLLVIHTNLLLLGPEDGIAGCVALSPNMRYLFLTGWSEEHIETLLKLCEPLHVPLGVLRMPFDRPQLIAALKSAVDV
jgi:hypothetical protein